MGILPAKASPTWSGVHLNQRDGTTIHVPWTDAIDSRLVRIGDRWIRCDIDTKADRRAKLFRKRALRNAWRSGRPVTWLAPRFGPIWVEWLGITVPVSLMLTLSVMCLTFAVGRMQGQAEMIKREDLPWWLAASVWFGLGVLVLVGVGLLAGTWFVVLMQVRAPVSLTIRGNELTLVRRDRVIHLKASEIVDIRQTIRGAALIRANGGSISLGQIPAASYEPWAHAYLDRSPSHVAPARVAWSALSISAAGVMMAIFLEVLRRSPYAPPELDWTVTACVLGLTAFLTGVLMFATRHGRRGGKRAARGSVSA